MLNKKKEVELDCIFIGTSMISIFEAVYQSENGKNVLMIDKESTVGGVWKSLDIFQLHDVENAIHYLLYDENGINFMRDILKWDVVNSKKKHRIFNFFFGYYLKVPYENWHGHFLGKLIYFFNSKNFFKLKSIYDFFSFIKTKPDKSFYVNGGTNEMLSKTKNILSQSTVKVQLNCLIKEIKIFKDEKYLILETSSGKLKTKSLFITHGSRLPNIKRDEKVFEIIEKIHKRPAVHLYVKDDNASSIFEAIFVSDPVIKYVHDVSRFTREAKLIEGKFKVLVFALHHNVNNQNGIEEILFNKVKLAGIVGKNSKIISFKWSDVILPTLYDDDLYRIKEFSNGKIEILRTDDFCRGIGYYSSKWSKNIQKFVL